MKKLLYLFVSLCFLFDLSAKEFPKYLWFDAEANFVRFSNRDTIRYYLDKTKETGFNTIVVDVRPIYGEVLYKKTRLPQLEKVGKNEVKRDWDYLQFFIDEAHKREMKVVVSTTFFTGGNPVTRQGLVYSDKKWASKTTLQWTPEGFKDIKDDPSKVSAFLNPSHPEVQDYVLSFVKEIVENYDIDGYALDYCRYPDVQSDFSSFTRHQFEKHIGKDVKNFPEDIFRWENGERIDGSLAQEWFEFRSQVIYDFISRVRETIKGIKPDVSMELWAASWYSALYVNGQNWASQKYNPYGEYAWASEDYYKTGYAGLLDVFLLGTYLDVVWGMDNNESMEYGIARGKRLIAGDCLMYGTMQGTMKRENLADAAYICLKETGGLMVFDIVHIIERNAWSELKKGIDRAEAEMK